MLIRTYSKEEIKKVFSEDELENLNKIAKDNYELAQAILDNVKNKDLGKYLEAIVFDYYYDINDYDEYDEYDNGW